TPYFSSAIGSLVIPLMFDYKAHAFSYGFEGSVNWNITNRWKLSPSLTILNMSVTRDASSQDSTIEQTPGYSPRRSFQARSFLNLGRNIEWDQTIGYAGPLAVGDIPGYWRLDTRFGWRFGEFWEFSLVAQNLLRPRHAEFPDVHLVDHMLEQR